VQLNTLTLPRAKTTYPVRFVLADQANKPLAPDVRLLTPLTLRNRLGTSLIITGSADERSSDPSIPMVRTASFPEGEHELQLGLSWQTELYYADLKINVTNPGIDQPVQMVRGPSLSGTLLVIGPNGNQAKPAELFCKLRSEAPYHQTAFASSSRGGCLSARFTPGKYHLEVEGVPSDAYVESAKVGAQDVLADGIQLDKDTELHIVIRTPGATIGGTVIDMKGEKLSDALVALVPDAPLRDAGPLYRSIISDFQGSYEIRGVAPGSYRLFAWTDLEGAASERRIHEGVRRKGKTCEDRGRHTDIHKSHRSELTRENSTR